MRGRITEHFRWAEVAYRRRGRVYWPCPVAQAALRRTCELVLEPLRALAGRPVHILAGGGYDPLRDESGAWVSHRAEGSKTRHHLGGALDFRVGARKASEPWELMATAAWVEALLADLKIGGGLGLYPGPRNGFLHIDLRAKRARWKG